MAKKVCIFTSVHPPFDTRIFHKQAKTLAKAGYEVTLIAQHDRDEVVDGIKIIALPKPRNRFWRMLGTWRVFRLALRQKADIYHFHDPELLPWGWLLKKVTHRPVIYDCHEDYAATILSKIWIPSFLRRPTARIFAKMESFLASKVPAIITATEPMTRRFPQRPEFCVSVHNFPSLDIITRVGKKKGLCNQNARYSVIYAGKLHGGAEIFETILDALNLAVRSNREVTCLMLARADNFSWLDKKHKILMHRLVAKRNLQIHSWVPHDELVRYLNASAIGWKPGLPVQEAISTKVLEYMACAKPVVTSDYPLTSDIIQEAKCGILVDPYDTNAHAEAILYLLEHPDEAKKMGENGRKAVEEKYNWEKESQKLLSLYQKLTEQYADG